MQGVLKFGQLIKSICTNYTWNESTKLNEEHVMDTMIRQSQGLLTNTENDLHVTTTTRMGRRIFSFCFLDGGKVGAVLKGLVR